jgi:hypothetical protein
MKLIEWHDMAVRIGAIYINWKWHEHYEHGWVIRRGLLIEGPWKWLGPEGLVLFGTNGGRG